MSSVRIKICGITSAADARLSHDAGADYLGFVFHPGSPRAISPESAGRIIRDLPEHVTPVGVFVDPGPGVVERIADISGVRIAQLAGDESPEFCRRLPLPVIKVVRPSLPGETWPGPVVFTVFATMVDGCAPGKHGGTGVLADLDFAASCAAASRCFLAGGLRADNVGGVITRVRPFGVDVSSGTELRPGVKDPAKVREFCRAIHDHYDL